MTLLLLATALTWSGCKPNAGSTDGSAGSSETTEPDTSATLSASPNPVPAGPGSGTTTITWDGGKEPVGGVYVSINGGEDTLMVSLPEGSKDVDWIVAGAKFEFRLFSGPGKGKLLKSVTVTREGSPSAPEPPAVEPVAPATEPAAEPLVK